MFTTSLAVLALSLSLAVPQTQDARAEAERLARAGNHAEALRRFQQIVTANPDDITSRLWIGRLQMELGEPRRAAAVYESIVATQPQNVDALLGLGLALTADGRLREASDALNRAESLAADRIDVLAAQGALHAAAGRSTLATAYYGRAQVLEPTNLAIKEAADAVRATRAHRIDVGYDFQHFNTGRSDSHTGTIEFNGRVTDTFRVFAVGQTHRNLFDDYESRGGGGVEWLAGRGVWIRGGALGGSGTVELPSLDVFGSIDAARGRTRWSFEMRFVDFDGADLLIGGPGLEIDLTPRLTFYTDYHRGRTSFEFGDSSTSDSVTLGIRSLLGRRASGFFEYRHGIDRLEWLTIDRVDADDANTISVGGAYDVTPFVTLHGRFDHQQRPGDISIQRGSGRLTFRF